MAMNEILYSALCACFGLSPSSDEASLLIREAYQEPEPFQQPPRNTDVIYYAAEPDPMVAEAPPAYGTDTPAFAAHTPSVSDFSAWRLHIVCYGPGAADNARKIRAFLYLDGAGFPRAILRKAGLYPVLSPPEPLVLHEPEGSLWRLRADLTIRLRMEEKQDHPARRNAISVSPAVRVVSDRF